MGRVRALLNLGRRAPHYHAQRFDAEGLTPEDRVQREFDALPQRGQAAQPGESNTSPQLRDPS
jgi:hypothetical protein